MRRQWIARQAEWADPETGSYIYLAGYESARVQLVISRSYVPEGVQDRSAWRFADHGLELQKGRVGLLLEGGVEGTDRDDEA